MSTESKRPRYKGTIKGLVQEQSEKFDTEISVESILAKVESMEEHFSDVLEDVVGTLSRADPNFDERLLRFAFKDLSWSFESLKQGLVALRDCPKHPSSSSCESLCQDNENLPVLLALQEKNKQLMLQVESLEKLLRAES